MARKALPVGTRKMRADGFVYVKQPDGTWKKSGKGAGARKTGKKVYKKNRTLKKKSTGWQDYR